MVTVNRTPDHFWNHVIRRAEGDGAEPEKQQVIRVPPADSRLQNALHRHNEKHQLSSGIQPWEPEKRAEQIPLRDVNLFAAAIPKHEHRPGSDERISDKQNDRRVTRELEPLISGAVADQNRTDPEQHTEIPKTSASNEQ